MGETREKGVKRVSERLGKIRIKEKMNKRRIKGMRGEKEKKRGQK